MISSSTSDSDKALHSLCFTSYHGLINYSLKIPAIAASLTLSAPIPTLTEIGAAVQLTVTANFSNGSTADVTPASTGTNYTISNPTVATVSPDGIVTALSAGTVIVSVLNEGALGLLQLSVSLFVQETSLQLTVTGTSLTGA